MSSLTLIERFEQALPPSPTWSPDDSPDLTDKVILVTGGNTGIGREMVKTLLRKNAKVYLAARSTSKGNEAIEGLRAETGRTAEFLQLDLSDLVKTRDAARDFSRHETRIDVLFLNAGVMFPPVEQLTEQGYDLTFGTNVIGHFLFLRLLYPLLLLPQTSDGRLSYETFTEGPARRNMSMFTMYVQSKLAQVLLSNYLARHAAERGENVVSIAVDPGNIRSEIFRGDKPWYLRFWERFVMYPLSYGALTPLYAGVAPEAVAHNGKYLRPWTRLGRASEASLDEGEQEKLWTWLEEQIKEYL